jgi:hypothetical protein
MKIPPAEGVFIVLESFQDLLHQHTTSPLVVQCFLKSQKGIFDPVQRIPFSPKQLPCKPVPFTEQGL